MAAGFSWAVCAECRVRRVVVCVWAWTTAAGELGGGGIEEEE